MKKTLKLLSFAFVLALAVSPALLAATSGTMQFNAGLRGTGVPGGIGALNGFGNFFMTLNGTQATITSSTIGLGRITGITLLQNGQPVLNLSDNQNTFRFGQFARTIALDPALAQAIAANPQNFSIQITTTDFPLGAIRGNLNGANTQTLAGALLAAPSGSATGSGVFTMSLEPRAGGNDFELDFDVNTNGIGNDISSLALQLPGMGNLVTLVNAATANSGRLIGSTVISAAQAQQLLSNPSGAKLVVNTPSFPNGALSGALGMSNDVFIPIVGSVRGAAGTNWKTALSIFNAGVPGSTAASDNTAVLQFSPAGGGPSQVALMRMGTHNLSNTPDISSTTMFPGLNGIGALRIATTGNIFANARIFNDQMASGRGTFGENVPALTRSRALSQGVLVGLSNVVNSIPDNVASARSNIGLFNPNDTDTDIDLELRDADGNLMASRILTVPAGQLIQLPLSGATGLFNTITNDIPNATVDFLSAAPMFVYASEVDNTSGDASFMLADDTSELVPNTGVSGG